MEQTYCGVPCSKSPLLELQSWMGFDIAIH